MTVEESIRSIQDICQVSETRARDLFESATGSVERAVEIHFLCSEKPARTQPPLQDHRHRRPATTPPVSDRNRTSGADPSPATPQGAASNDSKGGILCSGSEAPREEPSNGSTASAISDTAAAQQHRTKNAPKEATGSPRATVKRPRLGTLHQFLGLPIPSPPPKTAAPQRTMDDFFKPRRGRRTSPNRSCPPSSPSSTDDNVRTIRVEANEPLAPSEGNSQELTERSNPVVAPKPPEVSGNTVCGQPAPELPTTASTERASSSQTKGASGNPEGGSIHEESDPTSGSPVTESETTAQRSTTSPDAPENLGPDVPYAWLAATLSELSTTTKRTEKLQSLVQFWTRLLDCVGGISGHPPDSPGGGTDRDSRDVAAFTTALDLISGRLSAAPSHTVGTTAAMAPSSQPIPLQVSGSSVTSAVEVVTGASRKQLRDAYRSLGDLGDCAARYFQPQSAVHKYFGGTLKQSAKDLTIGGVHRLLCQIATVSPGKGSLKTRQDLMIRLLRASRCKDEVRFLVRTLLGNMRLGATLKTIVTSLATAFDQACQASIPNYVSPADPAKSLQQVFNLCPCIDRIFAALLVSGIPAAMQHCSVEVRFPIQPMLANPAHSLDDVFSLMTSSAPDTASQWEAVAEWKYDGVRCQAHWDGTTTKLFSRNMLESTVQYPDAVEHLLGAKHPTVTSFIVDSEVVGVIEFPESRDGFRLLPFQDLSTRRGSHSGDARSRVQIRVYAFDLLYLNGESLLTQPLWRRQELLHSHFTTSKGFGFASSVPISPYNQALIEATLRESIRDGAEGLMIKLTGKTCLPEGINETGIIDVHPVNRDFGYQSGLRSQLWLKLKRDYVNGFGETTVDVIPVGAWLGTGRKAQNGFLSPVLFAIYDEDEGAYYSISRCMSFSDEMYVAMREFYFRGTPYPIGVGMSDETGNSEGKASSLDAERNGEDNPTGTDPPVAVQHDTGGEPDCNTNDLSRVNCLSGRPSWIVTNESPPIWFKPLEVFEVSFADMTLSRSHTAAANLIGDPEGRGIALRFPRFKRRRPDKSVEQATTSEDVARLFFQQSKIKG